MRPESNDPTSSRRGTTAVLCISALTHAYLLFSVFPYAGYFALFLLADDENDDAANTSNKLSVDSIGIYVGLLSSAFTLGRLFGFVPWKKIRSRYGEKPSLIASLLLSALFSITFGMSQTFASALLSRFALGLSNGMGGAVKRAAIDHIRNIYASDKDGVHHNREVDEEWIMSRILAVMSFGCALGPAASGWLSFDIEGGNVSVWTYPYLLPNIFQAFMCLISAVFVALVVSNDQGGAEFSSRNGKSSNNGESRPLLQAIAEDTNLAKTERKPIYHALSIIWKAKSTRRHLRAYTVFSFCIACVDEALPLFLIADIGGPGLGVAQVGLVLGTAGLITALLQRWVAIGNVLMESMGGLYPTLRLSAILANVPMALLPISLVLGGRADAATTGPSAFETVTGMSPISFAFVVLLASIPRYFGFLYFGVIGVATGRTVPRSYSDSTGRIMTWFALTARATAPIVAGGIVTLLPGHPWKVWIIIGGGIGVITAVMSYALREAASAGWKGITSDIGQRRSTYLSQKQRALVYTKLWEVHYDLGSQTVGAKWRRLARKVIAINRMTGESSGASEGPPQTEVRSGDGIMMLKDTKVTWSQRMLRPGINFDEVPFFILGTHKTDIACQPHVMTPPLMEALQKHLPGAVCESNYWLKYSLIRDGASLTAFESKVGYSKYTVMAVETLAGSVFGCFMAIPWQRRSCYNMSGQSFLWRMKEPRSLDDSISAEDQASVEENIEIYPWTGENDFCQLFSHDKIAVGGGLLDDTDGDGFGFVIHDDLASGSSSPCKTYRNPCLVSDAERGEFEVANIEVWSLTPFMVEADAERHEESQRFRKENSETSEGQGPSSQSPWSQFL